MAKTYKRKEYIRKVSATDEESYLYPSATDMIFSEDGKKRLHQILAELETAISSVGVSFATQAEANALTETKKAVAPATIPKTSATQQGIVQIATQAENTAGSVNNKAVATANAIANQTNKGLVRFATAAEIAAGTIDNVAIAPDTLESKINSTGVHITGSYTGTGEVMNSTNRKVISGLTFTPKRAIIFEQDGVWGALGTYVFTDKNGNPITSYDNSANQLVVTPTTFEFYGIETTYATLNHTGRTYYYTIFG